VVIRLASKRGKRCALGEVITASVEATWVSLPWIFGRNYHRFLFGSTYLYKLYIRHLSDQPSVEELDRRPEILKFRLIAASQLNKQTSEIMRDGDEGVKAKINA